MVAVHGGVESGINKFNTVLLVLLLSVDYLYGCSTIYFQGGITKIAQITSVIRRLTIFGQSGGNGNVTARDRRIF
jgi:hypothetical protein